MEENKKSLHIHTKSHMNRMVKIRANSKLMKTYNSVNFSKSQLQSVNLNRIP